MSVPSYPDECPLRVANRCVDPINHPGACPIRSYGQCMHSETLKLWSKFTASAFGTLPAVFIVIFMSQGFKTVPENFANNIVMTIGVYGLLLAMWIGSIWFISEQEHPTLGGYVASSAGFLSSTIGLGATVLQFLIPGSGG